MPHTLIPTIAGLPTTKDNPSFSIDDFKLYIPKLERLVDGQRGSQLFNKFKEIADNKIIENIWNSDWEFAMSLCIAHYLDIWNRDFNSSFSLEDQAKQSGMEGLDSKFEKDRKVSVTKSFKEVSVVNDYAKFWNQTMYGQRLINLLQSKAIPTMIVVN